MSEKDMDHSPSRSHAGLPMVVALLLAACNSGSGKPAQNPVAGTDSQAIPARNMSGDGQGGFAPLQSAQVKDAIHRALRTGQNQRWQDGAWSGYAVPSLTILANGCRTIRYTIDQQPNAPVTTINACDANRP